jgi:hypothetical protein
VDLADLAAFLNLFNTPVGPPDVVVIDTGLLGEPPIPFEVAGAPFVHAVNPGLDTLPAPGTDFHPGIREQIPGVIDSQEIDPVIQVATEGQQTVCVPQPLRCIYQVTCIESDCDGCSMQMLDLCLGSACDNDTCPTSFRRTCGESECCLEYTLVECRVPQGEPTCPEGDFCTCLPVR